ncbi:ROK family transcriptional regulator [Tessaracoccus sp. OH4464_COT-324]|uniref:ROK family transcriptional regulator n=1 Tax=Tessaracoccus sp. OH4464_COT-324 TaxID=2491059 RepID=UPI001319FA5D|nr:ROK family transcriptional regulator [Tessaracoccus sp. OH4464_COT-324]
MDSIPLREGDPQPSGATVNLLDSNAEELDAASRILQALATAGGATRLDLVELTDLPRSTVSATVRRLVADGEIEEFKHASSTGGRRPTMLRLAKSDGAAYVAELGSHHARIGVATLSGVLLATDDIEIDVTEGPEQVIQLLTRRWRSFTPTQNVLAVGLCVPGPVSQHGRITSAARMPGWNGVDVNGALQAATDLPAVVENDARAAAIGEWSARDEHNESCIYIKAGTGVGAGWISGGVAYRGAHGFAGDVTHIRIQTDDPQPCSCGNSGCLETVASGAALLRQLAALGSPIRTNRDLVAAANGGDHVVTALVREAGARIGEVLSGIINFLNPSRIVIGGSMSQMGALLAGFRSELYDRCLPTCTQQLAIETSLAGPDAPLIGMSVLARQLVIHPFRSNK